ncbi:MAG: hypothetical protein HA491_01265 [Candidatus Verstraetearchaeota archaeon]|nr:hypothetical protein [Candidatus Verstraetearchaeota archaeon]
MSSRDILSFAKRVSESSTASDRCSLSSLVSEEVKRSSLLETAILSMMRPALHST